MTNDLPDTVYVPSRNGGGPPKRIHIDSDCPRLNLANNILEKDPNVLQPGPPVCRGCGDV